MQRQLQKDYISVCNVIGAGWVLSETVSATLGQRRSVNSEISKVSHCHSTGTVTTGPGGEDKKVTCGPWVHTGPTCHAVLPQKPIRKLFTLQDHSYD